MIKDDQGEDRVFTKLSRTKENIVNTVTEFLKLNVSFKLWSADELQEISAI